MDYPSTSTSHVVSAKISRNPNPNIEDPPTHSTAKNRLPGEKNKGWQSCKNSSRSGRLKQNDID
jgi:hypothetical protein